MWSYKGKVLILMAVFVGFGAVCWGETAGAEGKVRVIAFPKERSIGSLYAADEGTRRWVEEFRDWLAPGRWGGGWEYIGEATGEVTGARGKKNRVDMREENGGGG